VLTVAAALTITATATACGSGPGSSQLGGAAQGISVEVPGSFSVLDMTSESSVANSIAKLGMTLTAVDTLVPQVKQLQQQFHAAMAVDAKTAVPSSGQFPDNVAAYCVDSGTDLAGSSAVPVIKQRLTSEFSKIKVTGVSMSGVPVGGVPGLEATYVLDSSTGPLTGGELAVAPKPQRLCYVTLTTWPATFSQSILSTAAQSAQFS
jgi:hypothetical protein